MEPSGEQYSISFGEQHAVIVEVGGGIRAYTSGGQSVLQDYAAVRMCDGAHGCPLIPWPNRLEDGRYSFDGVDHQLALTEPTRHNAIHGLLRWRPWVVTARDDDRVTMGTRLHPSPGYPFGLEVRIEYQLGPAGLTVRTTATNVGDRACPFGSGHHPYLSPGDGLVDACVLEVPAAIRVQTDSQRQLPTGTQPVDGTDFDFRRPRRLGGLEIDFAFRDLTRDADGLAWTRLRRPDGLTAELWMDRSYPLVQIYTADTLAPERRRRGLGVEPLTCPPNAFRTGTDVRRLEPGESVRSAWGVRLVAST